jgi:hypothetical protein
MQPAVFVHADNTTGQDSTARRKFKRHKKCSQCGAKDSQMVAAHVVAYPWFNCCFGFLTLKTTCSACNNTRKTEENPRFAGTITDKNPKLGRWLCWPCCVKYDASEREDRIVYNGN